MFTATTSWYDMVKGQVFALLTAILAAISVTLEDLMLSQFSLPSWTPDEMRQPDYRWNIKNAGDRVNITSAVFNDLSLFSN
jgi:hypothetical protein